MNILVSTLLVFLFIQDTSSDQLSLYLYDLFGDGWGDLSLEISSRSTGSIINLSPSCENPNIEYIFNPSDTEFYTARIVSSSDNKPQNPWEIFWTLWTDSNNVYVGGYNTSLTIKYNAISSEWSIQSKRNTKADKLDLSTCNLVEPSNRYCLDEAKAKPGDRYSGSDFFPPDKKGLGDPLDPSSKVIGGQKGKSKDEPDGKKSDKKGSTGSDKKDKKKGKKRLLETSGADDTSDSFASTEAVEIRDATVLLSSTQALAKPSFKSKSSSSSSSSGKDTTQQPKFGAKPKPGSSWNDAEGYDVSLPVVLYDPSSKGWFRDDYSGAAFYISDQSMTQLVAQGTLRQGVTSGVCRLCLPEGSFYFRVTGGRIGDEEDSTSSGSDLDDGVRWSFCHASGGFSDQLSFHIVNGVCVPDAVVSLKSLCQSSVVSTVTLVGSLSVTGATVESKQSQQAEVVVSALRSVVSLLRDSSVSVAVVESALDLGEAQPSLLRPDKVQKQKKQREEGKKSSSGGSSKDEGKGKGKKERKGHRSLTGFTLDVSYSVLFVAETVFGVDGTSDAAVKQLVQTIALDVNQTIASGALAAEIRRQGAAKDNDHLGLTAVYQATYLGLGLSRIAYEGAARSVSSDYLESLQADDDDSATFQLYGDMHRYGSAGSKLSSSSKYSTLYHIIAVAFLVGMVAVAYVEVSNLIYSSPRFGGKSDGDRRRSRRREGGLSRGAVPGTIGHILASTASDMDSSVSSMNSARSLLDSRTTSIEIITIDKFVNTPHGSVIADDSASVQSDLSSSSEYVYSARTNQHPAVLTDDRSEHTAHLPSDATAATTTSSSGRAIEPPPVVLDPSVLDFMFSHTLLDLSDSSNAEPAASRQLLPQTQNAAVVPAPPTFSHPAAAALDRSLPNIVELGLGDFLLTPPASIQEATGQGTPLPPSDDTFHIQSQQGSVTI